MKRSLFVCAALLSASCATVPHNESSDGILSTYYGHPYHVSILEMGPPTQIYSDGNDGRILHWEHSTVTTRPAMSYTTSSGSADVNIQTWDNVLWGDSSYSGSSYTITRPPTRTTNTRFIQFYVNPAGDIYHHRTNMLSPAEQEAAKEEKMLKQSGYVLGILGGAFMIGALIDFNDE